MERLRPTSYPGWTGKWLDYNKELKITKGVLEVFGEETRFYYVAQAGQELTVILLPQHLSAGTLGMSHHAVLLTSKELGRTRAFPTLCL